MSATEEPAAAAGPRVAGPMHDPATAHGQLGLAFKRAMVAVRRLRGRETHRPGQVSYAQHQLLHALAEHGAISARELAGLTDLSPATVTQMLDGMEVGGLISRVRSTQDRRVVLSALTAHGVAVVQQRREQLEPRWRAALAEFEPEELQTAARVLNRLADFFDAMLDESACPPREADAG